MATLEFLENPFTVYCRRSAIEGLRKEKIVAETILNQVTELWPAICLFCIKDTFYLYGQCSFERETGDGNTFKFSDTLEHIVATSALPILIEEYGVRSLILTDQLLMDELQVEPTLVPYINKMEVIDSTLFSGPEEVVEQDEKETTVQSQEESNAIVDPKIDLVRPMLGRQNAPVTIVAYGDMQCPFTRRGWATVKRVRRKYKSKIRVFFKHCPLDFHPSAEMFAKYFEAVSLQDHASAWELLETLLESNMASVAESKRSLPKILRAIGVNVKRVSKDVESETVRQRIKSDIEEAGAFGVRGTPCFSINGYMLRGAYPIEEFIKLIDKSLESVEGGRLGNKKRGRDKKIVAKESITE
jgi:protein-disulfide isomerase